MIVSWLRKNCPKSLKNVLRGPYEYGTYVRYKTMERLFPDNKIYACPCCGLRFSHLTDGGFRNSPDIYNSKRYQHTRQDVICPFCRSLPRHRILATWCEQHIDSLRKTDSIFCVGKWYESLVQTQRDFGHYRRFV